MRKNMRRGLTQLEWGVIIVVLTLLILIIISAAIKDNAEQINAESRSTELVEVAPDKLVYCLYFANGTVVEILKFEDRDLPLARVSMTPHRVIVMALLVPSDIKVGEKVQVSSGDYGRNGQFYLARRPSVGTVEPATTTQSEK